MAGELSNVRVQSLHRYPVKSLLGERLDAVDVDDRGVVGDRLWSVRTAEGKIGSGKNSTRFAAVPGLLLLRSTSDGDDVVVTWPDGTSCRVADPNAARLLSDSIKRPLTFARETSISHFDDGAVSLVGLGSVAALSAEVGQEVDVGRFRPNIVVSGLAAFAEDELVGRRLRVGEVQLEVTMRSPRCVMIDMESADLPRQHGNLLGIGRINEACLGVIARVLEPGRIAVSDAVDVG